MNTPTLLEDYHYQIQEFPIKPEHLVLPLDSNYASTADLLTSVGSNVNINQVLTKNLPFDPNSISIHSPTNGIIREINNYKSIYSFIAKTNNQTKCIIIQKSNEPSINSNTIQSHTLENNQKIKRITLQELIKLCKNMGIVGLGGAGFPTNRKINHNINTLLINAVECETPITADTSLILSETADVIYSIVLLQQIINPLETIIAVKNNSNIHKNPVIPAEEPGSFNIDPGSTRYALDRDDKSQTLQVTPDNFLYETLKKKLIELNITTIKLKTVAEQYPNGYSKTLIKNTVDNNLADPNKHSCDLGIMSINVATAYYIYRAIVQNRPLVERVVTIRIIYNDNIIHKDYIVPIGTTIDTILKLPDLYIDINSKPLLENIIARNNSIRIKVGGDYMGSIIFDSQEYNNQQDLDCNLEKLKYCAIDKSTQVISIFITDKMANLQQELVNTDNRSRYNCINCSYCEPVCPVNLLPQQLYKLSIEPDHNKKYIDITEDKANILQSHFINNCIECGLCDTVCPSDIPLTSVFKHYKSKIKILKHKQYKSTIAKQHNINHSDRIEYKNKIKETEKLSKINAKSLLKSVLSKQTTKPLDKKSNDE